VDRYSTSGEAQLLDEFRRHARQYLVNSHSFSEWDWIFVAQHHGLPTRLVDWSTNPLVACFFACEESPNGKRPGHVTAISPGEVGYLSGEEQRAGPLNMVSTRFVVPTAVASRIIAQRGLFTVHSQPTIAWRARGKRDFFEIPADLKKEVKTLLLGMGVDAQFLMADLDGLTSTLKWRYANGIASQ
jgi:FRG domain